MKVIIQRVKRASVTVEGKVVGKIDAGLLLLVGLGTDDTEESLKPVIEKIMHMRIFSNDQGKFHYSALETNAEILAVPQFTLFADTSKGRRPDFFGALEPKLAKPLFHKFAEKFADISKLKVEIGEFGADMKVELLNDGPVTIIL